MKVLITGAAGYIGSVLSRLLLNNNYEVIGLDNLLFGGDSLISLLPDKNFRFVKGDIRNQEDIKPILEEVDAIVHLAAIVGDPACSAQTELSKEVNFDATKTLYDLASNQQNINRFIFASTCSNYGKMDNLDFVNEDSELKPVSLYAELKVRFEEYLLKSNPNNQMASTSLRFSTVYGSSPRMRFDLTVNDFMREIASGNELLIFGKQFWRPYCHVDDLARSCLMTLESDEHIIKNQVFGVGDTKENYQKEMIAEEILKIVPDANIKYVEKNEDPRDYRVDFSKIEKSLDFKITKKVPDGLREIYSIINNGMLLNPYSKIYCNI